MEMKWNDIDSKVREFEKTDGIESTFKWFRTNWFFRVMECSGLREIEANVNLLV